MAVTTTAARTRAMATPTSLEETGFDLEDCGRTRDEILAGKDVNATGEGGEGGAGGD